MAELSFLRMKTNSYYNFLAPWDSIAALLGLAKRTVPLTETAGFSLGTHVVAPAPPSTTQCTPYFVALDRADDKGANLGRVFLTELTSVDRIREECTARATRVALHWGSSTHRLLGIDLDASLFGPLYENCVKQHKHAGDTFCVRCWWQMCAAACVVVSALCSIVNECLWSPDTELAPCVLHVSDIMATFSGSGGIHLWVHPRTGLHNLSQQQRAQLIDTVVRHWRDYIPAHLVTVLEKRKSWLVRGGEGGGGTAQQCAPVPVDQKASSAGESQRTLRLPFSPHLQNAHAYVNTPLELNQDMLDATPLPRPPRAWAIQWFHVPLKSASSDGGAFTPTSHSIQSWREEQKKRVARAVRVFDTWWYGTSAPQNALKTT